MHCADEHWLKLMIIIIIFHLPQHLANIGNPLCATLTLILPGYFALHLSSASNHLIYASLCFMETIISLLPSVWLSMDDTAVGKATFEMTNVASTD